MTFHLRFHTICCVQLLWSTKTGRGGAEEKDLTDLNWVKWRVESRTWQERGKFYFELLSWFFIRFVCREFLIPFARLITSSLLFLDFISSSLARFFLGVLSWRVVGKYLKINDLPEEKETRKKEEEEKSSFGVVNAVKNWGTRKSLFTQKIKLLKNHRRGRAMSESFPRSERQ